MWEPDPEHAVDADSPVRASLDLLEELLLLNAAVKAIARSRLTGRGILLVPKGVRFPTRPGQGEGEGEDDLIELLMMIAETAIREPESAAATVPIGFGSTTREQETAARILSGQIFGCWLAGGLMLFSVLGMTRVLFSRLATMLFTPVALILILTLL